MSLKAPTKATVAPRAAPMTMSVVGQTSMKPVASRFQPLAPSVTPRSNAAGPTMMMGTPSAASASSFTTSGFISNVEGMQSQRGMRTSAPTMFAGGMPVSSDYTIKNSSKFNAAPMRNYFDTKLGAGRRGDVKMMASYNVTFITPDGE